jgi:hypothetical protein
VICGAEVGERLYFCRSDWFKLPLAMRDKWRRETDLSSKAPSRKLVAEMRRAING